MANCQQYQITPHGGEPMVTEKLPGDAFGIARAGEILRAGGLVAIPTETVYGLAANALDPDAVRRIYAAKGRPADNPLIVHITETGQWAPLAEALPEEALRLAEAFWPGPLTIILKKSPLVPMITSGGLDTVAVRCPSHPLARAVIEAAGVPLAAPSANLSGRPSPTSFSDTLSHLEGRVEAVLDGGDCAVGVESTVVSLVGDCPRLLRPGGVTAEELEQALGRLEVDPAVTHMLESGARATSPGMKYKHYAPKAQVTVVDGSPEEFAAWVNRLAGHKSSGTAYAKEEAEGVFALCFEETAPRIGLPAVTYGSRYDRAGQARELFSALHRLDSLGARQVYAQRPAPQGVGLAVYNRLLRAAAFREESVPGPMVIGLVGPSGAGKSTFGAELGRLGFQVLDCDSFTRSDQVYDGECLTELQAAFGEDVVRAGVLDRRLLASRAFADGESRARLEAVTLPRIVRAVRDRAEELLGSGRPVVLDAPTLFESGLDSMCRRIVAVTAPERVRLERILERDGLTEAQALQRLRAQPPMEFYRSRADILVDTGRDGDPVLLARQAAGELKGGGG